MKARRLLWIIILLILIGVFIDLPAISSLPKISTPEIKIPVIKRKIPALNINLVDYTNKFPLKLGLDLQGGTQLVLQTDMSKIAIGDRENALESARQVIERRVNLYGVSESVVQSSKLGENRRILVDLPGIKDASAAASLVGKTAQLDFREIPASRSAEATMSAYAAILYSVPTGLTGADLKRAQVTFSNGANAQAGAQVAIEFTGEGAKKFADITKRNVGKPVAIFLDDQPVSAPNVQQEILGGNAVITGNFTSQQAKDLAVQLNAGALPVPIKILEQRSVGASLGQESINKSIIAGLIGLLTVIIFMAVYYGKFGIIADIALIIYSLFTLAIFKTGFFLLPPVTLTLAGIAGFVLSVGMAVDANILIFERMKEEKRWGASPAIALDHGFKRAWSSIRDSNISSLITAAILYFMGTGLVRGFAITLAIGVLVSMFTAITVTRTFLKLVVK